MCSCDVDIDIDAVCKRFYELGRLNGLAERGQWPPTPVDDGPVSRADLDPPVQDEA